MSDWDYFWRGLLEALSWKDGQDNVLIGGAPSWTYLLGLFVHFFIAAGIFSLFFLGLFKERKETGSWKYAFLRFWDRLFLQGRIKGCLTVIIGLPIIFVAFPYYEGYRIANGVWRYHYFTSQETSKETILVTDIETDSGRKSNFSRVTMTAYVNSGKRIVNISNSNKALVRKIKEENKNVMVLNGEVNKEGKIVFID